MKVRDCHTIRVVAEDGTVSFRTDERWLEIDGVITQDEAKEQHRLSLIAEENDAIRAQLQAADIANLRALYEGDKARIAQHKASQAALRAKIREVK